MEKEQLHQEISSEEKTALLKRKWLIWVAGGVALAVLCLIVAAVVFAPEKEAPLPPPANGNWTVNYIQSEPITTGIHVSFDTFGHFYEDLNEHELRTVVPKRRPEWMTVSGESQFTRDGYFRSIELEVSTTLPDQTVNVAFFSHTVAIYVIDETMTSVCNGVEYMVYERVSYDGTKTILEAFAYRSPFDISFYMIVPNECLEQGKQDFKEILESFTYYGEEDKPDWKKITYEYIPESYRKEIYFVTARKDEDFGVLIPETFPQSHYHGGFRLTLTEVTRTKAYGVNSLSVDYSGVFTGDAYLTWDISYFDETYDTEYLVHTDEDWETAYYPIFYVDEVTSDIIYQIRALNQSGKIKIKVKCGDYLISIYANSLVKISWIEEQIQWLSENY